jgi:hypothetical protein
MKAAFTSMVDRGWLFAASVLACAPAFAVDTMKLDRFQTGIPIMEQTGQAKWVDDTTLLVTTPIELGKYDHWNAKVVTIDLQAKRVTTITAAGFLKCANPRKHYFVVAEGSHEKTYFSRASTKPDASDPRNTYLYTWSPANKAVVQRLQLPSDTEINPHICKVTLPAHTQAIGQELRRQGILYVDDKKALVATALAQEGPQSPLRLINDGQPPKPLDGQVGEIEPTVSYQSHDNSLLLKPGQFTIPAKGEAVKGDPALVFYSDQDQLARVPLADELKADLQALGQSVKRPFSDTFPPGGVAFPVKGATLLLVPTLPSELTGFYLKKPGQPLRRIQCSSLHGRCIVRELMIAPGGCHVAYTPGDGYDRSFISLNLCSPEAP